MMNDDMALVRDYAARRSEPAFETLVTRYVNLVFSAAVRQTGDQHLAEEITQATFIILAGKAGALGPGTILPSWLHRTTAFVVADALKARRRRAQHEREAAMETILNEPAAKETWAQIAPLLDSALTRLAEKDRAALVLRFFENRELKQVGAALGVSEDAAKKRVSRALEKLRRFFLQRGVNSTAEAIGETMSANSIQAAPAALAKSVTAIALAKGTAASTSTLILIKGALKIMAWAKAKTAVVIGAGILFAAGTTTVAVKEIQEHRTYPWQVPTATFDVLYHTPPQVAIVPSKFKKSGGAIGAGNRVLGIAQPLEEVARSAYGGDPYRTIVSGSLPQGRYDFIANLPRGAGSGKALQSELRKKFGVIGDMEKRETNVMLLTLKRSPAEGLKPGTKLRRGKNPGEFYATTEGNGEFKGFDQPIGVLTHYLENRFRIPVVDTTGLTNSYDMTLHWDETDQKHPNLAGLKQALLDQLGLELVPTNMPIEMLVIEKAK